MKRAAKKIVTGILGWQVRRFRIRRDFTVIAVLGSIGKTSTKFAVAKVLSEKYSVRWQKGNYNDIASVPLVYFDQKMPSLMNPVAWIYIFIKNEIQIRSSKRLDFVVLEIGTDGPGQIMEFQKYGSIDLAIVTAITAEHMEFFKDIEEVAKEELSIALFSKKLLINIDFCDENFIAKLNTKKETYGIKNSDYTIKDISITEDGASFEIESKGIKKLPIKIDAVSKGEVYSAACAAIVASSYNVSPADISRSLAKIKPVSGRMQRLGGIKNSLILDETYNASPEATLSALESLYNISGSQKIAILGSMNELGDTSKEEHQKVGQYCVPEKVNAIVTLGSDANTYLAEAAEKNGCNVYRSENAFEAAEIVKNLMKDGAIVLVKGSQGGVFAEEAVKMLLKNREDEKLLVRQDKFWLKTKQKFFGKELWPQ